MSEITIIYGKEGCPHTRRAREAIQAHEFIDVEHNPAKLEEMLKLSNGQRKVPVIVAGKQITIGYNGGA